MAGLIAPTARVPGSPRSGTASGDAPAKLATQRPQPQRVAFNQRRQASVRATAADGSGTVVTMGEALFDCLADQLGVPREQVQSWTPYPGGAPANVACALARLGLPVLFVSALGDDDLGRRMLALLQERGIDCGGVQASTRPTRDVLVTRSLDGDREFCGFGAAPTTEYADCFVAAEQLPLERIQSSRALVTGTLGLAYPETEKAMHAAVQAARAGSATIVVDVNWRPVFWADEKVARGVIAEYLQGADLIKFADTEVEWLLGIGAQAAMDAPEKVLELYPAARGVLISAGEKGSSYAFRGVGAGKQDASGHVPVLDVSVVDTTGAGDAFLSGFLYRWLTSGAGASPEALKEAVYFAAACGAYTCTGPGAIDPQPTEEQALSLLTTKEA